MHANNVATTLELLYDQSGLIIGLHACPSLSSANKCSPENPFVVPHFLLGLFQSLQNINFRILVFQPSGLRSRLKKFLPPTRLPTYFWSEKKVGISEKEKKQNR